MRVVLCGIGGRMGQALCDVLTLGDAGRVVAGVERPDHPAVGAVLAGVPVFAGLAPALAAAGPADVVIDFTRPAATAQNAQAAAEAGLPFVSGTTGLDAVAVAALDAAAARVAVVWAPNMSVGVNVLAQLVAAAADALGPEFAIEILELHHGLKVDAPSGTALQLAHVARLCRGTGEIVHGRVGQVGARPQNEIGVHALRGGDVAGEHTVFLLGPDERLELTHRLGHRRALAAGAVRAARFACARAPGRYGMADVLGLGALTLAPPAAVALAAGPMSHPPRAGEGATR